MYDKPKIEALVSAVRRAATANCVLQVAEHFAAYFDELGITVSVKDDTSDEEIRELKNKVSPALATFEVPFLWLVTFQRRGKSAGALFPDGLLTGTAESSRVAIVLEPENQHLETMASTMPVWAVESPSHRSTATRFWNKFPNVNQRDVGLTLFRTTDLDARYENFVGVLDAVEEHHWGLRQLHVFGLKLTEQSRADLQTLGFGAFTNSEKGFIATKQP
jgi:hypothetical protein